MFKRLHNAGPALLLGLALLVPALAPAWAADENKISWRQLRPGLEFALIPAEEIVRSGNAQLAALRVDPALYRFRVLTSPQPETGFSAEEWLHRSGALAVFNAGQYAPDHSYLGLLVVDGQAQGHVASKLDALFMAEPGDPALPQARVLDLRYSAFDLRTNPYRQIAQSHMLLDRFGQIRVRRSPLVANRTTVAEDDMGRVIVLVSEGGLTLWELATFLKDLNLGLRDVMSMDGAGESQLALRTNGFRYRQVGTPTGSPDILPWPVTSLPVALGVFPRK
ncbi:hypothetical protein AAU61_21030 [Desulfocarbo indianensis]|nr:hypothetical protein AAU61_21030 [Desulfocarbo indianensis]